MPEKTSCLNFCVSNFLLVSLRFVGVVQELLLLEMPPTMACSPAWHFSGCIAIEILSSRLNLRACECQQVKLSSPMLQWRGRWSSSYSLRNLRLSQRQTALLVKAKLSGIASWQWANAWFLVWSPAACQAKYRQGIPEMVVHAPYNRQWGRDCPQ